MVVGDVDVVVIFWVVWGFEEVDCVEVCCDLVDGCEWVGIVVCVVEIFGLEEVGFVCDSIDSCVVCNLYC